MSEYYYDLDNFERLPLAVINCISINHGGGRVRASSSCNGFHVIVDSPCYVCKKYSDPKYERLKDELGFSILFGNKGRNRAGEWWTIKNCGVYDE